MILHRRLEVTFRFDPTFVFIGLYKAPSTEHYSRIGGRWRDDVDSPSEPSKRLFWFVHPFIVCIVPCFPISFNVRQGDLDG